MSKGLKDKAAAIIAKYHGNGNADDPLVKAQLDEIQAAVELAHEGITWRDLFASKSNRNRLLIIVCMTLMTLWCGQNIITYYFSSILNSIEITNTTAQ